MNENKWIIQSQFFIIIGLLISIFVIGFLKNRETTSLTNSYKNSIKEYQKQIKEAEEKIQQEQYKIDSLDILLANKQQTIINNNYFYEKETKRIANFDARSTDSLYKLNLRTMYKRYGHLLNNK